MKSIKFLLPIAALALSGLAAASSLDTNSVVVHYGDLNLNSQAGVVKLHKRIRNAAASVCSDRETRILALRYGYDQCVADATARGVAEVANPNLSNFHASKGKAAVLASNSH